MVQPGFSRPISDSHHAVRDVRCPLPGSQNMGSEQTGTAISNRCPTSTPKNPGELTPITGNSLPSSLPLRVVTWAYPAHSPRPNPEVTTLAAGGEPGGAHALGDVRPTTRGAWTTLKKLR